MSSLLSGRRIGFIVGSLATAALVLSACSVLVNDALPDPEGGIDAADDGPASPRTDASDASKDAGDACSAPCSLDAAVVTDAATDGPRDAAKDG